MLEKTHHFQLAKDALGADQALEYVGQFFQSYPFAIPRISDGPDNSKGSVADRPIWQIFTGSIISSRPCKTESYTYLDTQVYFLFKKSTNGGYKTASEKYISGTHRCDVVAVVVAEKMQIGLLP